MLTHLNVAKYFVGRFRFRGNFAAVIASNYLVGMIYDESHDLLLLRLCCVWVLVDIVRVDFEMVSKLNYNSNWCGKSKFD